MILTLSHLLRVKVIQIISYLVLTCNSVVKSKTFTLSKECEILMLATKIPYNLTLYLYPDLDPNVINNKSRS